AGVSALGAVRYERLGGERAARFTRHPPAELARVVGEVTAPPPSEAVQRGSGDAAAPASPDASAAGVAAARDTDLRRLARLLRGDLDAIVMKALRKEPQHRYASVEALLADLESHRAGRPVA